MKIGIIGAGMIGGTAARLFARAGHDVAVSNAHGPESLDGLVKEINDEVGTPRARAMTRDDAARWGDVVLLAVPWRTPEALPGPATVRGKIVIDAMNPYGQGGTVMELKDTTSSEETARRLPGARIVKAFNTLNFQLLRTEGHPDQPLERRRAILVAGDDADAKRTVSDLVKQIGFAPVDTGSLRQGGRRQQPGTPVYNKAISPGEARELLAHAS